MSADYHNKFIYRTENYGKISTACTLNAGSVNDLQYRRVF